MPRNCVGYTTACSMSSIASSERRARGIERAVGDLRVLVARPPGTPRAPRASCRPSPPAPCRARCACGRRSSSHSSPAASISTCQQRSLKRCGMYLSIAVGCSRTCPSASTMRGWALAMGVPPPTWDLGCAILQQRPRIKRKPRGGPVGMSVRMLTHIGICVSDLTRARAFYTDVLGLKEVGGLETAGETVDQLLGLHRRRPRGGVPRARRLPPRAAALPLAGPPGQGRTRRAP